MTGPRRYTVEIQASAQRTYRKLPDDARRRIKAALLALEHSPRPVGCKAMVGRPGHLRIRVGDYRVIYTVRDSTLVVLVVELGHRRDVYR